MAALRNSPPAPVVRLRCGNRAVTLPSHLLLIGNTVECPSHPLLLAYLHTAECKCKCKTFLLSNSALSPKQLEFLDSTPFGVKIVKPNATMLGLHLHSPHRSVTPRFSLQGDLLSPLPQVARAHVEKAQLNTAVSRMLQRVRAGINLGLSFRERTLFLSFYVLSLPHYHHSTLLPSSNYIANYYRLIRQHLCKRAWIQAKHLPGVVTYLKLGILHCPKIFLLSSMLGLCIRLYGLDIVLWLCGLTPSLPFLPKRILEGLDSSGVDAVQGGGLRIRGGLAHLFLACMFALHAFSSALCLCQLYFLLHRAVVSTRWLCVLFFSFACAVWLPQRLSNQAMLRK